MASTNKTPHYSLSQFVAEDKPSWMTDYNSDMLKIDTAISAAQSAAEAASTLANQAQQAGEAASASVESMQESIQQTHDLAESAVITAGQALTAAQNVGIHVSTDDSLTGVIVPAPLVINGTKNGKLIGMYSKAEYYPSSVTHTVSKFILSSIPVGYTVEHAQFQFSSLTQNNLQGINTPQNPNFTLVNSVWVYTLSTPLSVSVTGAQRITLQVIFVPKTEGSL